MDRLILKTIMYFALLTVKLQYKTTILKIYIFPPFSGHSNK